MTFQDWLKENDFDEDDSGLLCIPDIIFYARMAWNAAIKEATKHKIQKIEQAK